MSQNALAALQLLLLVLVSILLSTHGNDIGETCNIGNSSDHIYGICKLLHDCLPVYADVLAGKVPENTCGFLGFEPIVCCATIPKAVRRDRGSLARAKCAEAAEAVYDLELSPIQVLNRRKVTPNKVSRCGLKPPLLIAAVGGIKADPKEFPHMAAVGFTNKNNGSILWICGGSLISAKIVLTAAHCTWNANWGIATWVRVGDLNIVQTNDDAMPQEIKIAERIRHPDYKGNQIYNDIAVLRLEKEVIYNAYVRPACLPVDLPDIGTDNKAVATGWGVVDWSDDTGSDDLVKVTLKLVDHATCNASISDGSTSAQLPFGILEESQLCAGELGKDTCQGDSGGPLAIFNKDHDCVYNIIGITSFGRYCGDIIPGVYTRVYNYIPWIERTAWPEYFSNNLKLFF